MKKLLAPDEPVFDAHDQWYWPVGAGAVAVAIAIAVVLQRGALVPPGSTALWAGVAVAPWVVDAVLYPTKRIGIPVWLFVPVVVGAAVAILLDPVMNDFAPFFFVLLSAEMASRLVVPGGLVVLGVAWAAMLGLEVWGPYDDSFIWFVGVALGWAGGFGVQTQFRLMAEMKASQATMAAQAVAEERARIAREIHDVVAHTLSVTMLHLTGARLALERGDRDEATAALLQAEAAGRESLADIRRTVGVLADEGAGTDSPMPTAVELPELVGGFRAAGLDVELDVHGDPAALSAATGLAVYRIAQESLANVVKHAPGAPARVRLDIDGAGVRLEIVDRGNGSAEASRSRDGRGVEGMKERAELLGGTLRAGRGADGWVVDATLPGLDARQKKWC